MPVHLCVCFYSCFVDVHPIKAVHHSKWLLAHQKLEVSHRMADANTSKQYIKMILHLALVKWSWSWFGHFIKRLLCLQLFALLSNHNCLVLSCQGIRSLYGCSSLRHYARQKGDQYGARDILLIRFIILMISSHWGDSFSYHFLATRSFVQFKWLHYTHPSYPFRFNINLFWFKSLLNFGILIITVLCLFYFTMLLT